MRYNIFIVDDHPVVRRGLRQLFEREPDFRVSGEMASAAEVLHALQDGVPDLVLADLALEGSSGLDLARQLRTHYPNLPVLILSMHDEELYAARALGAGARGYVMKRHPEAELLRAARTVLAGHTYVSETLRQHKSPAEPADAQASIPSRMATLTDRELEVFMLLGQGYAPRHIAETLSLSVNTVEVYRQRLKEKLGLESADLLTRYAVRWCRDLGTDPAGA